MRGGWDYVDALFFIFVLTWVAWATYGALWT